jgi:hypothetical protein
LDFDSLLCPHIVFCPERTWLQKLESVIKFRSFAPDESKQIQKYDHCFNRIYGLWKIFDREEIVKKTKMQFD